MKNYTDYILANVEDNEILKYCVDHLRKNHIAIMKALGDEKNQLASEIASDSTVYLEILCALNNKLNGEGTSVHVA